MKIQFFVYEISIVHEHRGSQVKNGKITVFESIVCVSNWVFKRVNLTSPHSYNSGESLS